MAGRYPPAWLDELRARADIVQIVSGYVQLKKSGGNYWGLCPFHGEKTASFSVSESKQMFYCFGCKAGGSVIRFIMDIERLDYHEAVRYLADRVRLPLPQMLDDPDYERRRTQRERLLNMNREAARYYHQLLFTPDGERAMAYLKGRGLSDQVIRRFGLGAAPDAWDTLTAHLTGLGYSPEEMQLCGLAVVREAQPATADAPARPRHVYDVFRDRVMFPIIDQYGNVIAFGGRIMGKGERKYINTSDTPVFNKRKNVYAANLLRKQRQLERVILVEGYMDVVSLSQYGVAGVCATLGTALTPEQAKLLSRFAPKVYLAYDGDSAGQNAIMKGLDILRDAEVPARVLVFPDGLDPDEFIRQRGAEAFASLPAISPETFRIRRMKERFDLSSQEGRTEYARACAGLLRGLDPVELENQLRELSLQTGFTREVLLAQIQITPPERQAPPSVRPERPLPMTAAPAQPALPGEASQEEVRAQETILSLLASGQMETDVVTGEDFTDPLLRSLYEGLASGKSAASVADDYVEDEQATARVSRVLHIRSGENTDETLRMAQQCLHTMQRAHLEKQRERLTAQAAAAQGAEKAALLRQILELQQRLAALQKESQSG